MDRGIWSNESGGLYLVAALVDIPAALAGDPGLVPGVTLTLVRRVRRPALLVHTVRVGVAVRTETEPMENHYSPPLMENLIKFVKPLNDPGYSIVNSL